MTEETFPLPKGWRLVNEEIDGGTGYGDERYGWVVYQWRSWTSGHLWWKKRGTGWVTVKVFRDGPEAMWEARRYIVQTDVMLRTTPNPWTSIATED